MQLQAPAGGVGIFRESLPEPVAHSEGDHVLHPGDPCGASARVGQVHTDGGPLDPSSPREIHVSPCTFTSLPAPMTLVL